MWLLIALVIATVAFVQSRHQTSTTPSASSSASSSVEVVYMIGGTTTAADLTLMDGNGQTSQQNGVDVPVVRKSDGQQGIRFHAAHGSFVYVSAQNQRSYGTITCSILADGAEILTNQSSGGYSIVTCSGRVP